MGDAPTSAATEATNEPISTSVEQEKKELVIISNAPDKSEDKDSEDTESKEQTVDRTDSKPKANASSVPTTSKDDTDMKAGQADGASTGGVAKTAPETVEKSAVHGADVNPTTPATTKKTNGNPSTKKKSAGVPEHKSRKLNRKKSKPELHLDCKPGELYLARMKGHTAWPSIVADEDILPPRIIKSRPVTAALPDGSFKRPDYGPGGKRQNERTYPIMFLHTNEFAWLPNTDLTPLKPEDCVDPETKGKTKALLAAYAIAAEDHDLQYFKDMVADHKAAVQEEADRVAELKAEKEAAKAAKAEAKKARRKSAPAVDDEEEDAMDVDVDDDGETQKPKSKKRKKAADVEDDAEEKPAKAIKLKLNGPKTPASEKKTAPKPKASNKKAAKKDSDEDMEDAPAAETTLSPAELKEKKEKEIRYYRHKLQKGLLSREDTPSDDEIATASNWLGKLETYPGLEGEIIRGTKIHKVLRAILRLPSIPKDEVYNIKKRSTDLLSKWNSILGESGADAGHEAIGDKNGTAITEKKDSPAEAKPELAAEKTSEEKEKEETSEEKASALQSETKLNGTSGTPAPENNTEEEKPAEPSQEQAAKDAAPEAEKSEANKPAGSTQ